MVEGTIHWPFDGREEDSQQPCPLLCSACPIDIVSS